MTFTIPSFVAFGLVASLALRQSTSRAAFLALANVFNVAFILLFFGVFSVAILLAITIFGFILVRLGERFGPRTIGPALALIVILFVTIKQYPFVPKIDALTQIGAIVGVSYIVFRLVHLIIDASEHSIERVGALEFFNLNLSFLTLLSGPIVRYQEMENWRAIKVVAMRDLLRVGWGLFKVSVISAPILDFHKLLLGKGDDAIAAGTRELMTIDGTIVFAAAAWFVYLYFNFSGYMDIVIGLGRIAGVELPENFNRPFRANSFLQFWNRWHMTLSFWFRTYVFSPLFKTLYHRFPTTRAWHTHISLFLTFLLVGAWHGTTWSFVVCGLILAIGAVINESWPKALTRALGRARLKGLNANVAYQSVCFGLTFAFLSVAFIPFWMPESHYFPVLGYLARPTGALVFAALWLAAALYIAVFRATETALVPATHRAIAFADRMVSTDRARTILLAVALNVIAVATLLNFGQVQTFVYQTY